MQRKQEESDVVQYRKALAAAITEVGGGYPYFEDRFVALPALVWAGRLAQIFGASLLKHLGMIEIETGREMERNPAPVMVLMQVRGMRSAVGVGEAEMASVLQDWANDPMHWAVEPRRQQPEQKLTRGQRFLVWAWGTVLKRQPWLRRYL